MNIKLTQTKSMENIDQYIDKTESKRNQTETKIFVREVGVLETKGAQILLFMERQFKRSTQQSEKVNQNVHVWILL